VKIHTAIILIIILIFWFKVYASGTQIGSPGKMWDLLIEAAKRNNYSAPTKDGSYLTIRSLGALKFAILSILEYTGVVFLDNSFHQKGIAADPASAIPGYVLGGLAWYAMPFTLATTMGILAAALENTTAFPTYPRRMNTQEIGAGLALPYAAQTIAGKGGAGAGGSTQPPLVVSERSSLTKGVMCSPRLDVHELYQCYLQCDDRHLYRSLLRCLQNL
jgi:urea-proton symporter